MTAYNTNAQGRDRMPVIFVGHGSPMNAIENNRWSRGFAALRDMVPRPVAILAISAHWYVDGTFLTGSAHPKTIHDFGGFPDALYEIDYPAPGNVDLAERVRNIPAKERASLSNDWGLDHGIWSVLRWMYPQADVPVIQLSIDRCLDVHQHYALGRSLTELRNSGILIVASGNVVHNLREAFRQMQTASVAIPEWAHRFDETVKQTVEQHDTNRLLALWPDSADGRLAHPSPEHWLPLLYAVGAADKDDRVRFPIEGFDWGTISMRAILFG
jgi:4,5-DOPA dioxygenase extradiol